MFAKLIGEVKWKKPAWLIHTTAKFKSSYQANRKRNNSIVLLLALAVIAVLTFFWFYNPAKIPAAYAAVTAPSIMPIDSLTAENVNKPQAIAVNFYSTANPSDSANIAVASVAPLNLIGHTVPTGIQIQPAITGTWHWETDSRLIFTPKEAWHANTTYTISFSNDLITAKKSLKTTKIQFTMPTFAVSIAKATFNLDLKDPAKKNIAATIEFNYPVKKDSVENHLQLTWADGQTIPVQIHFDPYSRRAYLQSAPISIGKQTQFANLIIQKGIETTQGNQLTSTNIKTSISIPSLYTYLKIEKINTNYVIDNRGNANQILTIMTNIGATTESLSQKLQVTLLSAADTKKILDNNLLDKPQAVTAEMLARATVLPLTSTPTELQFSAQHSFIIQAPADRLLLITINSGLVAQGGFLLEQPYKQLVETALPPKTIQFIHKGSLLALTGEQKLEVLARGVPAVKITVYKILPQNLNQLLSQTYGDLENPQFLDPGDFNQENISQAFSEIKTFPTNNLQTPNYFPIDISVFQTPATHMGLYLLQLQGYNPETKELLDTKTSRLVVLTNLGIIVKTNADNTQDVFVQSIVTGNPVVAANVTLIAKNGVPIMESKTDAAGHAHFFALGENPNNAPLAYVVSDNGEQSFIPFKRADRILNLSRFNIDGTYWDPQQKNQLNAFIFTDSGLYRPGSMVHFGLIVKSNNFASDPEQLMQFKDLPLTFAITSPEGRIVNQQAVNSNELGFLTRHWASSINATSGIYTASLYLGNKVDPTNLIGSEDFTLEAFTPVTMKLSAAFNTTHKDGWVSGENLQAMVNLQNLYGLPANHNKITAEMDLMPGAFYFAKYPDYQFVDPLVTDKQNLQTINEKLSPAFTDATGQANLRLNLNTYAKASYFVHLYAKGYQQDGTVAAEATAATIMVSPLPYVVGYKSESHLDFLRENSSNTVSYIALDPTVTPIALANLSADLYVLEPISVLVEQADGTYAYQTKTKATLVKKTPFAIAATGTNFTLPTDKAGNFRLVIASSNGQKLSSVEFTVVGKTGFTLAQEANLSIKLDKAVYTPGEQIKIALHLPYAGAGLISIEKDDVAAFKWFHSNGGDTTETIDIPANFHGTGYVEVNYARAADANEIFMNPFSYAVVPFRIDTTPQTINIQLQAPAVSLPGAQLPITYSADKPSKILIFAVDKGILAVDDYQTPDPLNYFFSKQALQVATAQTLDLILPRFQEKSLSTTGGDGGALTKNLVNPFQQNQRKPVMVWSKLLDATADPQTFYYKVPEYFNGDLQIMAVAVNNQALGSAKKHSYIQAHFIMAPSVPAYVTPGDTFSAALVVTNNLKSANASDQLNISLAPNPHFVLSSPAVLQTVIKPGQSQTVHFNLTAKTKLGSSELKFIVSNGKDSSELTEPVTVQPASLYQVNLQNGFRQVASFTLPTQINYYPEYRNLRISVSNQASIFIPGLIEKIQRASFYNAKQMNVRLLSQINSTPRNSVAGEKIQQKLNAFYNELPDLQNSDGSFSGINFLQQPIDNSLLVMNFLTIAKSQGYQIPTDLFNLGINYLQTYANQNEITDAISQAKAIFILTENEELTTNAIDHLQAYLKQNEPKTWQNNIAVLYLAASYQMLQQQDYATNLVNNYLAGQTALSADAIQLLCQYFPTIAKSGISSKTIQSIIDQLNQQQSNIAVDIENILALQAYAKLMPNTSANPFQISALVANQWQILATNSEINQLTFPAQATAIRITQSGNTGYFYQLMTAGYAKKLPMKALADNLQVDADIQDGDAKGGNSISTVKLGDVVTVHLRIRSLIPDSDFAASIINLLPAGFQLIDTSLDDSQYDQVNIRDDRLLFNIDVDDQVSDITYQLRATTVGKFIFPPVMANSDEFGVKASSMSLAKEITVQ